MNRKDDKIKLIALFLKCFFIFLCMGLLLPNLLQSILSALISDKSLHGGSVLVSNVIDKEREIITIYISLLKMVV